MKLSRLTVTRQGNVQTVAAIKNQGGSFIHIKPDTRLHRKAKLILRNGNNKTMLELNGRQIQTLKKVLNAI